MSIRNLLGHGRVSGLLVSLALLAGTAHAQFSLLHEFAGGGSDGSNSFGNLTLSGSTLYGMTRFGGDSDRGTVFKLNSDGTGFSLLHEFAGGVSDGWSPSDSLTISGSTLYGMTPYGGGSDFGTVFKLNTDGTGFSLLHSFAGGASDGSTPLGSLTLSGSTLYGMTESGGASDFGTVFKLNTDGTGFSLLHSFAGGSNGRNPQGSLTLSGSTLYGMTSGSKSDLGTVFKINTDGTDFSLLHSFAGGGSDGANPYGSLTLSGSTLYGMTSAGGDDDLGTLFTMNTDGTGFSLLHEFAGSPGDGRNPQGSLTLSGSTLYGMTRSGGGSFEGTGFSINTNGTGFSLLHEFAGGGSDGRDPYGDLTLSGSTLYGMTYYGGDSDAGTVFSYSLAPIPEPSTAALLGAGLTGLLMRRRKAVGGKR
jgi:uncharacterized repeat protein (TIGR03803 family)